MIRTRLFYIQRRNRNEEKNLDFDHPLYGRNLCAGGLQPCRDPNGGTNVEPTEAMAEPTEEMVEPTEEMAEPTEAMEEPTEPQNRPRKW